MVYVDEKGMRYELQYSVKVREDGVLDRDLIRNYVWASREQIENAMNEIKKTLARDYSYFINRNIQVNPDKLRIGPLEVIVNSEQQAKEFAKKAELPFPVFVK